IFPDVFDRIELRSVGWQTHKGDVFGDRERGSNMIAGAVEDESGVWLPAATLQPIAGRCSDMVPALAAGMTRPAATRGCGHAAPPTHDTVHRRVGTGLDKLGQFGLLPRREF